MEQVKSFNDFVINNDNVVEDDFKFNTFEDYSNVLKQSYSTGYKCMVYEYENCMNNNIIVEGSFNRLLDRMKTKDFAILSAYRNDFSKKDNILRNRKLRGILNDNKMGVHQLVGHWLEAPAGKDYKDYDRSELTDVIERSYFIAKPDNMSFDEFKEIILQCMTIDGISQDCCVIHNNGHDYNLLYPNGDMDKIGDNLTFNKIAQSYSEHVINKKSKNATFVFEGVESPSSISGHMVFNKHNIYYMK
ncbi:MAG: hypothetical protein NC548_39505 [Lachnospiraceae bacterium]|nr:hypothetical protein [Lachnospiraceae bacterium]